MTDFGVISEIVPFSHIPKNMTSKKLKAASLAVEVNTLIQQLLHLLFTLPLSAVKHLN